MRVLAVSHVPLVDDSRVVPLPIRVIYWALRQIVRDGYINMARFDIRSRGAERRFWELQEPSKLLYAHHDGYACGSRALAGRPWLATGRRS